MPFQDGDMVPALTVSNCEAFSGNFVSKRMRLLSYLKMLAELDQLITAPRSGLCLSVVKIVKIYKRFFTQFWL